MKYQNMIIFYAGSHSSYNISVSKFYSFIVKQIYCENVGSHIKHDGLYRAFLLTFK